MAGRRVKGWQVGKGGRYLRVKGGGHGLDVTRPEVVLKQIDQVWEAALRRSP